MGGSSFVFIESKSFEFVLEEGGSFFSLCIYERGRHTSRSVRMGKESAKRILSHVEELSSKQKPGQFARTVREGDRIIILQLGSNAHGTFLLFSELDNGRRRGSIIIPEGYLGSGWRRFGIHLRKTIFPVSQNFGVQHRRTIMKLVGVMENLRQKSEGAGNKGKEMMSGFQNLNPSFSWGGNSGIDKVSDAVVVTSVIKDVACCSGNISPTLDITLRVERGIEGEWHVISSKVIEVGPIIAKPSGVHKLHSFKSVLSKGSGPRPHAAWKPKAQTGLHKALSHKPKLQSSTSKPTLFEFGGTQSSVATYTIPSPACNTAAQLCEPSPQPSVSDCHDLRIGSLLSACANTSYASVSPLSAPLQVAPGLGSSAAPTFAACDSDFGSSPRHSSKPSDLPPLYNQKVGCCLPTGDGVGMGSGEGNFETDSARSTQQEEGSEKTEQILTTAPQDFGPTLSDYVDQLALEGVVIPGKESLVNEGQIISRISEYDGVEGSVVSEFGSEGEAWDAEEGLLNWEHLGEPLEVVPLAVDNSVVMEIPTGVEKGCTVDVDNSKLSLWVTNRIKAFQKSVGTSLEGFEEQVTGLLLALEARRKKRMLDIAPQRKMGKAGLKGHRELKKLLNSWGEEKESERSGNTHLPQFRILTPLYVWCLPSLSSSVFLGYFLCSLSLDSRALFKPHRECFVFWLLVHELFFVVEEEEEEEVEVEVEEEDELSKLS
ncbi:hypothetical protein SO802_005222 [Lithocarpus litseifolius]|uniref:Uncharacterized protein n=1 Tax=Lithocarpus litseifolius TaxID=425828 RepID=A0AAW2DJ32_9ROSI